MIVPTVPTEVELAVLIVFAKLVEFVAKSIVPLFARLDVPVPDKVSVLAVAPKSNTLDVATVKVPETSILPASVF